MGETPPKINTQFQHLHPDTPDSGPMDMNTALNRDALLSTFTPDICATYAQNGEATRFEGDFNGESPAAFLCAPISPWGNWDLMHVYLSEAPALNDVPPAVLRSTLMHGAHILRQFLLSEKKVAYMGLNNSMASWGLAKRGFMSVPWPHTHYFLLDEPAGTTHEELIERRRVMPNGDDEVTRLFMECQKDALENITHTYWESARITADHMGFVIELPGFTPESLHEKNFIPDYFHHLSLSLHAGMRDLYLLAYGVDIDTHIRELLEMRSRNVSPDELQKKLEDFRADFQRQDAIDPSSPYAQAAHTLLALGDDARLGGGWAAGMEFREGGASLAVNFGFSRGHDGPVQALGYELERKPVFPDEESQKTLSENYDQIVDSLFKLET